MANFIKRHQTDRELVRHMGTGDINPAQIAQRGASAEEIKRSGMPISDARLTSVRDAPRSQSRGDPTRDRFSPKAGVSIRRRSRSSECPHSDPKRTILPTESWTETFQTVERGRDGMGDVVRWICSKFGRLNDGKPESWLRAAKGSCWLCPGPRNVVFV